MTTHERGENGHGWFDRADRDGPACPEEWARRTKTWGMPLFVLTACVGLTSCSREPAKPADPPPLPVSVSHPLEREVNDYAEFTARTAAVDFVEVRAHVWGYLQKVNFKEGDMVKAGDVLFEIDPRPYLALLNQAKAKVRQDEAQLEFDEAEYQRNKNAFDKGAGSTADLDKARAARDVTRANIEASKAVVVSRQLDLDYTKVTAPVAGRTSRYVVTVGNLVQAGDQNGGTLLTTVVSVDPMYAYFDSDEHTAIKVRQLVREGKLDSPREANYPCRWVSRTRRVPPPGHGQLRGKPGQREDRYAQAAGDVPQRRPVPHPRRFRPRPHRRRAAAQGPTGQRPGLRHGPGQKILYVVDDASRVVVRPVTAGALHDGLREVAEGLGAGDRVVVTGLQQMRPGLAVEPKLVDMPGGNRKPAAK